MEFKVGDKVKLIKIEGYSIGRHSIGQEFFITELNQQTESQYAVIKSTQDPYDRCDVRFDEIALVESIEKADPAPLSSISPSIPVFEPGQRVSFKNPQTDIDGTPINYEPIVGTKGTIIYRHFSGGWDVKWDDPTKKIWAREDQLDHVIEENASISIKQNLTYKEFMEEFNFYGRGIKPDMVFFDESSYSPNSTPTLKDRLHAIRNRRR